MDNEFTLKKMNGWILFDKLIVRIVHGFLKNNIKFQQSLHPYFLVDVLQSDRDHMQQMLLRQQLQALL